MELYPENHGTLAEQISFHKCMFFYFCFSTLNADVKTGVGANFPLLTGAKKVFKTAVSCFKEGTFWQVFSLVCKLTVFPRPSMRTLKLASAR